MVTPHDIGATRPQDSYEFALTIGFAAVKRGWRRAHMVGSVASCTGPAAIRIRSSPEQHLVKLPFGSAPFVAINDCLVPGSVSTPVGGHRQKPLPGRHPTRSDEFRSNSEPADHSPGSATDEPSSIGLAFHGILPPSNHCLAAAHPALIASSAFLR